MTHSLYPTSPATATPAAYHRQPPTEIVQHRHDPDAPTQKLAAFALTVLKVLVWLWIIGLALTVGGAIYFASAAASAADCFTMSGSRC